TTPTGRPASSMTGAALNPLVLRNAAASATVASRRSDCGFVVISSAAVRAWSTSGCVSRFGVVVVIALVLRWLGPPAERTQNGRGRPHPVARRGSTCTRPAPETTRARAVRASSRRVGPRLPAPVASHGTSGRVIDPPPRVISVWSPLLNAAIVPLAHRDRVAGRGRRGSRPRNREYSRGSVTES